MVTWARGSRDLERKLQRKQRDRMAEPDQSMYPAKRAKRTTGSDADSREKYLRICVPISNGFVVNSKLTLLRVCFEDGLQYMAAAKPEECRKLRNTFVMQDVPVRDVIGLVYALTDEAKRETSFKNNTITVPICPASS